MQSAQKANAVESNIHQVLEDIILSDSIRVQLQPIISVESGEVEGYKTIARGPENSELEGPDELLNYAKECGLNDELEYAILVKALSVQHELPEEHFLSIRIGSSLFLSKIFREITNLCQHIAPQIVFELTEHTPLVEMAFLEKQIKALHEVGYRIALNINDNSFSDLERAQKLKPSIIELCHATATRIASDKSELQRYATTLKELSVTNIILSTASTEDAKSARSTEGSEKLTALSVLGVTDIQGLLCDSAHYDRIIDID
jgi:EAL domain-containing protein (putative c-di-GMP-specific phosphodiesterase class I)